MVVFIVRGVDMEKPLDLIISSAQDHAPQEDMEIDWGLLQLRNVDFVLQENLGLLKL